MANVYFISDLHFGHKNILKYEGTNRPGNTSDEHDEILINNWNSIINKKDLVYVLGDVAVYSKDLEKVGRLNGRKRLVRGNHDTLPLNEYLKYFENIYGIHQKYGYWLTHAPIHPDSLRNKVNIHGHVHSKSLDDPRYFSVCIESIGPYPISLDEIRKILT